MKTLTLRRSIRIPARYQGSPLPVRVRNEFVPAGPAGEDLGARTIDHPEKSQETVVLVGPADWPQNIYLAEAVFNSGYRVEFVSTAWAYANVLPWLHVRQVESFDPAALADVIRSYSENDRVRWIIPLFEDTIWAIRKLLPNSVKVFSPLSEENTARLLSKQSMGRFAAGLGVTVPREFAVDSLNEAMAASHSLGFPCVLKGEAGCGGAQVAICRDNEELSQGWARLATKNPSLQQFIDGNPWAAGGFFLKGQPIRVHLYEKLEQSPPRIGPPTRIRHDSPSELREALFLIARTMEWTGFLQVDFIRAADGQFFFLEINPRPWGSMTAANVVGADIFGPFVDLLHNRMPKSCLENGDGWSGYVFPKPVLNHLTQGMLIGASLTMLTPKFWRSIPRGYPWAKRLFVAEFLNIRRAYWGVSRRLNQMF